MLPTLKRLFGPAKPNDGIARPEIRLATVNEWWRLTRAFPQFRRISEAPLKDFGYLAISEHIQQYKPERILEFGYGFNPYLLRTFQNEHEMWGIDDFWGLPYFPGKEEWEKKYRNTIVKNCPNVRLVRGRIGKTEPGAVPENYFDRICSVSVLEEIPREELEGILRHLHKLLRPGGMIINSIDWRLNSPKKYRHYIRSHLAAGFDLGTRSTKPKSFDIHAALLENCTTVMHLYQARRGEERKFGGHWGTLFMAARRRCDRGMVPSRPLRAPPSNAP